MRERALSAGPAPVAGVLRPRGLVDLRGAHGLGRLTLSYPPGAVVVVSGLPGSGKSTLLRRWSVTAGALVVEPRVTHELCEAVMPRWLPYAVYRPWARLRHVAWLRSAVRSGEPLIVHDCGSRAWMRRWLARSIRAGRENPDGGTGASANTGAGIAASAPRARGAGVHLVLLDIDPSTALSGQRARGRHVPRHVFARHVKGLARLLDDLSSGAGAAAVPEAASVVLLDRDSRELPVAVEFTAPTAPGPDAS